MEALGQRNSKWANISLGTSKSTTIGSHGCTITCIAMLAGLTPDVVNERLNQVKGYANTNLVIWAKIKEAIPWLEFEWRGYNYDNDLVLATIKKHGGCLVEVDFDGTPRTDDQHWVLFTGNKRMNDPWTGRECDTSKYTLLKGFAIIKVNQEEKMETYYKGIDLNNTDSVKVCIDIWQEVVNKKYIKKTTYDDIKVENEKLKAQNESYNTFLNNLAKKLNCEAKEAVILGQVEELINKEDLSTPREKRVDELEKDREEKIEEIVIKGHTHPEWLYFMGCAKRVP